MMCADVMFAGTARRQNKREEKEKNEAQFPRLFSARRGRNRLDIPINIQAVGPGAVSFFYLCRTGWAVLATHRATFGIWEIGWGRWCVVEKVSNFRKQSPGDSESSATLCAPRRLVDQGGPRVRGRAQVRGREDWNYEHPTVRFKVPTAFQAGCGP